MIQVPSSLDESVGGILGDRPDEDRWTAWIVAALVLAVVVMFVGLWVLS